MIITNIHSEPLDRDPMGKGDTYIEYDQADEVWHVQTWDGRDLTDDQPYRELDAAMKDALEREHRAVGCQTSEKVRVSDTDPAIEAAVQCLKSARQAKHAKETKNAEEEWLAAKQMAPVLAQLQNITNRLVLAAFGGQLTIWQGTYLSEEPLTIVTRNNVRCAQVVLTSMNMRLRTGESVGFLLGPFTLTVSPDGGFFLRRGDLCHIYDYEGYVKHLVERFQDHLL